MTVTSAKMSSKPRGKPIVISGPSGVGKGSVIDGAIDRIRSEGRHKVWYSISATTRPPRGEEKEGIHYFFKGRDEFLDMAARGLFLEYAEYAGNLYGTPVEKIEEHCGAGEFVFLDIEVKGAFQVRENWPGAVLCFITPPSLDELEKRLRLRGTESDEKVARRLKLAEEEIGFSAEYDYVICNDRLDDAIASLASVLDKEAEK